VALATPCSDSTIQAGGFLPQYLLVGVHIHQNDGFMARGRELRKPIGITVPYREVGYKEKATLEELEKKLKALEKRIEQLEKEKK